MPRVFFLIMPFPTEKKNQLAKQDKSKKGEIDERVKHLLEAINALPEYYTTSSCSGRIVLWRGLGKKNEVEWLKVSHDVIEREFFELKEKENIGVVWLRLEPLILHVACKNLEAANKLLDLAKLLYKKSCLLGIKNKIMVEIRGSEFVEMPLFKEGKLLFPEEEFVWLTELLNEKIKKVWEKTEKLREKLDELS